MVKTEICLYVFLILLPAHIGSTCISEVCQECNNTRQIVKGNNTDCSGDFSVYVNSTGSKTEEGKDITLTCVHNFPNESVMFIWLKDQKIEKDQNKKILELKSVLSHHTGEYICIVNSTCGCGESSPHQVEISNQAVLLIIVCGISALGLIIIMGLVMKFKLKRDNEKHQERRRQRAQAGQGGVPNPLTPRPYQ